MKRPPLLPLALLAFSAVMAVQSTGFLAHDEIPHFLKAREALSNWKMILDIWGRPACTALYALGAAVGGLAGARLLAVGITALTASGTVSLLNTLHPRQSTADNPFRTHQNAWLWLLLYAQPLFLLNSFTVMTEMLLACAWIWAATLLARRRTVWAGLLIGLGGLARPEGWLAIAAFPFFLWLWHRTTHQDPQEHRPLSRRAVGGALAGALTPVLAWWAAGAIAYHNPRWMIDGFPWQAHSQYGKTGLAFLASALIALAVWAWIPVLLGAATLWKRQQGPALLLLVLPTAAFFLLHALLGTFGLMGSMSLPRYFLAVAPFLAILALIGLQTLHQYARRPRLLRKIVLICILFPGLLLLLSGFLPVPLSTNARQQDVAIRAVRQRIPPDQQNTRLLANDPYVFYRLNLPLDTPFHNRVFTSDGLRSAPPGTFLITDSLLWNREGRPSPQQLADWGYRFDPLVDRDIAAVPQTLDLEALGINRWPPHMGVALWIKDK